MTDNTLNQTRIIADWDYWQTLKTRTLSAANNQKWRKKTLKKRVAQQHAQHSYLERWARSKYNLLNKKNN